MLKKIFIQNLKSPYPKIPALAIKTFYAYVASQLEMHP